MVHRTRDLSRNMPRGFTRSFFTTKPDFSKKNLALGDRIIENNTNQHGVVTDIKKVKGEKIFIIKLDNGIKYAGFSTEFRPELKLK